MKHIQKEQPIRKEILFLTSHGDLKRPPDEKLYSASKSLKLSSNTKLNLSLALPDSTTTYLETPTSETWEDSTQPELDMKQPRDYDNKHLNSEFNADTKNKHLNEPSLSPTLADFVMPDEDWWNSLETIKELPTLAQKEDPSPEEPMDQQSLFETGLLATGPRPVHKWKRGLIWHYWNDYEDSEFGQEEPVTFAEMDEDFEDGPTKEDDPMKNKSPMDEDLEDGPAKTEGPNKETIEPKDAESKFSDPQTENDNFDDAAAFWKKWSGKWYDGPALTIEIDEDEDTKQQMEEDSFWKTDPQFAGDDPNIIIRESY